ncbi:hypothetical protein LOK49_LG10G01665 [Camellia lanceoleosa]|uniref:Uncharacterized protein n=1 Tax=Camellia lanceoleosa TaxID=1840588 RepID=A0ACC0GD44_9ERIC|nr:hypothetical protein LOK49_LG10G01665 [Camellia lanceoleosa]
MKVTRKGQFQCSGEADNFLTGKIAGEVNMSEPDSDVVRWGLHFLDVDQIFNSNYYGDNSRGDGSICHDQYTRDNSHVTEEEHLQASTRNHYSGYEGGQAEAEAEADDMGPSSSCSSPGGKSYDGEEYSYNLEIADDSALDGEVGKRLHEIIPVPHVPRINGEIPTIDEATSDHQRLLDRLQLYDLVEHKIKEIAIIQVSCFVFFPFECLRALSDQFSHLKLHRYVRKQVVNQRCMRDMFMEYGDYLKKDVQKSGEWGDHVTLQAAAQIGIDYGSPAKQCFPFIPGIWLNFYGVKIFVVPLHLKNTCSI